MPDDKKRKYSSPIYCRPTSSEVRTIFQTIGNSGNQTATAIGVNNRRVRNWQDQTKDELPSYTQWVLLCQLAAKALNQS